jgi:hypothetical protein
MTTLHIVRVSLPSRPPSLGPRRRDIDPTVQRRIESWVRGALEAASDLPMAISEWVSMDSRSVPHAVCVLVGEGREGRRLVVIEKACERIVEGDVRSALRSRVTSLDMRPALPA